MLIVINSYIIIKGNYNGNDDKSDAQKNHIKNIKKCKKRKEKRVHVNDDS